MKAYKILNQKEFTGNLFLSETFDNFLLTEADFVTSFTSRFEGRLTGREEDAGEFTDWRTLRPIALQLIRGKVLPKSIHIVLKLNPENTIRTVNSLELGIDPETVSGLYLNIRYEEEVFTVVTGISYKTFSTDRLLDPAWGGVVRRFLMHHRLDFEEC